MPRGIYWLRALGAALAAAVLSSVVFSETIGETTANANGDVIHWNQLVPPREMREKVTLRQETSVGGVQLAPGDYLVVHRKYSVPEDEAAYFYRIPVADDDSPVAAARCLPIKGPRTEKFQAESETLPDGTSEMHSIQFSDSDEVHIFDRATVDLGHPYVLGGVLLEKNRYIVVHHHDKDQTGAACMFIFLAPYRIGQAPVAKAHCTPMLEEPAGELTIRSIAQPDGSSLIHSIQFPGSREVHTIDHDG